MAMPAPKIEEDTVQVPASVRFPIELEPPEGFDPSRLETWPSVEGSLEWVGGRLLYMPPCGGWQGVTVMAVAATIFSWTGDHPEYVGATNEPGVRLGEDTRGADVTVWRRAEAPPEPGFWFKPPLLAVEVVGRYENEAALRAKARWYLDRGVAIVWVVLPKVREAIVITRDGDQRCRSGERLPADPRLPDLAPFVDDFFRQL